MQVQAQTHEQPPKHVHDGRDDTSTDNNTDSNCMDMGGHGNEDVHQQHSVDNEEEGDAWKTG